MIEILFISICQNSLKVIFSTVLNFSKLFEAFLHVKNFHKKIEYFEDDELVKKVASLIKDGNIIGWFQGRTEFGARALGNRSILGNPHLKDIKDRINKVVKKREGFRPFAPMVTKGKQHQYFEMVDDIPYMNQVVKVKEEFRDKLPAVTHWWLRAEFEHINDSSNISLSNIQDMQGFLGVRYNF